MPPDTLRSDTSNKHSSRKNSTPEEIDLKRARGEISCAECRRLKLKCDKKLPCGSCLRRGCASICPQGSLSTGHGTRFVLADTGQLHNKISEMGERIRQLEDALAIFQASVSSETHPLLREELSRIKFGLDQSVEDIENRNRNSSIQSIDALGTLTIGDHGEAKYFGRSAGSETLLMAGAELEMESGGVEDEKLYNPSVDIPPLTNFMPLGEGAPVDPNTCVDTLYSFLPPQPRAWSLCETYLEHATWLFRPIRREELVDDILTPTYKAFKERQSSNPKPAHSVSCHTLAALFMVFALGALVDLTLPPDSSEAENYLQLGRVALSLRSKSEAPELVTVQAVVLMASYHGVGGRRYSSDAAWALMSMGAKLAQSIGLHRDSARWNMPPRIVQIRRSLFWEIFAADLSNSLALGRPPAIRLSYVDCEFPVDDEEILDEDGKRQPGYYRWKYEFAKEVVANVVEVVLTAEAPTYQNILDLDLSARRKRLPPHLKVFHNQADSSGSVSVYMKGCLLKHHNAIILLYIHRSFFAQALLDNPANPLLSPYAPSFLAAYRCASIVIKGFTNHLNRFPDLFARFWKVWTSLLTASIIVGTIVTRAPSSAMTSDAFIELGIAVDLFEKGAAHSPRARIGLVILRSLRDKAWDVLSRFRSGKFSPVVDQRLKFGAETYDEDELAIFGGQTRVLVSRFMTNRSKNRPRDPLAPSPSPSSNMSNQDSDSSGSLVPNEAAPDIQTSLVEYMSFFDSFETIPELQTHLHGGGSSQGSWNQALLNVDPTLAPEPPNSLYNDLDTAPLRQAGQSQEQLSRTSEAGIGYGPVDLGDLSIISGESEGWALFLRQSGILDNPTADMFAM